MGNKKILVVGELNVDIILNKIHGFPVIGQEILADQMSLAMGSSSAIFASNIAVLGIDTSFCGMIGNDFFGQFILNELQHKGVNTTFVIQSNAVKTGATIVLNYDDDRANVTHCGAMDEFDNSHVPFDLLSQFHHLHFSSYFLQKGMRPYITQLFRTAKDAGLTTSLDLQWDPADKWDFPYNDCLPYVDVFLPNEKELLALAGEESLEMAQQKIGKYARLIVTKRGKQGSEAYTGGNLMYASPFSHSEFADAIGAGDSFNAGFISEYLKGGTMEECLRLGNLAGAINTTAAGGTSSFQSREAFEKKIKNLFNVTL
jgi:sugar/nucleoside kinase (ribokinase family)